jgi:predicted transcriptional regulator
MKVLKSQGAVARKLKISQPAVSKVLSIPTIRKMTESERVLYEFLAFLAEYLI